MTTLINRIFTDAFLILRNWVIKPRTFVIITLSTLLLLAQATYAAVSPVTLNIQPDNYGSETTWKIIDSSDVIIAEGGPYENGNITPVDKTIDLPISTGYTFTISDSYGDGICCGLGNNGSYSLKDAKGTVIASGGEFGSEEATSFDITPTQLTIIGTPATTIMENETYSFTPLVIGKNGSLTFSINPKPEWATFNTETGELSGTPTSDHIGKTTNDIKVDVKDDTETATLAAFNITVIDDKFEQITSPDELGDTITLVNANNQDDILTLTSDITLTSPLPFIDSNIKFIGNGHTISGNNEYRVFFVKSGNVTIENLKITHGLAQGGNGKSGGGGGAGMGGAIFVNEKSKVVIKNVHFSSNKAQGGIGGSDGIGGGGGGDGSDNVGDGGGGGDSSSDDNSSDDNSNGGFGGGKGGFGSGIGEIKGSGGGAAFGGAIFVRQLGELELINSHFENNSVTGGTGRV